MVHELASRNALQFSLVFGNKQFGLLNTNYRQLYELFKSYKMFIHCDICGTKEMQSF